MINCDMYQEGGEFLYNLIKKYNIQENVDLYNNIRKTMNKIKNKNSTLIELILNRYIQPIRTWDINWNDEFSQIRNLIIV
jgi:hypothetical protein